MTFCIRFLPTASSHTTHARSAKARFLGLLPIPAPPPPSKKRARCARLKISEPPTDAADALHKRLEYQRLQCNLNTFISRCFCRQRGCCRLVTFGTQS